MVYIYPLYFSGKDGKMTTPNGEIDITEYDKSYSLPWLKILLIASVSVPFLLVLILTCTVCIVLCVYLKENFKLTRLFGGKYSGRDSRPDKDYENEMLKLKFANNGPDEMTLNGEDNEEGEGAAINGENLEDKKKVMDFYVDMMRKEICSGVNPDLNSNARADDNNYEGYCYPLCEKKFQNGDVMRHISPCGHVFHEKCIRIWLFRGEN